ncbi:MAG: heparinase II/III family protein [Legionellaceae bacterium]|nr:heparinase II/III family protein [Legionellaceae bacterium]
MIKFIKLINTVRYLQWRQIYFQLYYRLRIKRFNIQYTETPYPRDWHKAWSAPQISEHSIQSLTQVHFLGEAGHVIKPEDWNAPNKSKLWLYQLHYFDGLNATHSDMHIELHKQFIEKWIKENPCGSGNGWEPYPLSLRIVNFVKWFSRNKLPVKLEYLVSFGLQTEALLSQIEYHILGNHLFANAKTLIFAGTYLQGKRADIWLKKGLEILDQEINEQFLPDGGHFELSPMYHATLLWDLCDLVHLANQSGLHDLAIRKTNWETTIIKAISWLNTMSHPDNKISFFNDATFGVAPELTQIKNYISQLHIQAPTKHIDQSISLSWLKDSGYCAVDMGTGCKAILDIAKIGPDYQPGHAHADTLSFELSLYGQRLIVNSGISEYGNGLIRQQQRSTRAHNTISIEGENSSEVWGGFRVARRAYPRNIFIKGDKKNLSIHCEHNGFLRLPGGNVHHRTWSFSNQLITIHDHIEGSFKNAEAFFYFHPEVKPIELKNNIITCYLSCGKKVELTVFNAEKISIQPSTWHPFFYTSLPNQCLVVQFNNSDLFTRIEWKK